MSTGWAHGIQWRLNAEGGAGGLGITEVRACSTGPVALAGLAAGSTLDGVVLADGDPILLDAQAAPAENGPYVVGAVGPPARMAGWETAEEFVGGRRVFVVEGFYSAGRSYELTQSVTTLGVDAVEFVEFYRPPTGGDEIYFFTDFVGNSSAVNGMGQQFGGAQFNVGTPTGVWGELRLRTSPAFGSAEVTLEDNIQAFTASAIGDFWFESDARVEALPTAADNYNLRFGQIANGFADGIFFQLGLGSPNWRCVTRRLGVSEDNDSLVLAVAGIAGPGPKFSYKVASDLSQVEFFINRARVARNTLNIPTATTQETGFKQERIAAAIEVGTRFDWMWLHGRRTP